jgi:hypothetical protein
MAGRGYEPKKKRIHFYASGELPPESYHGIIIKGIINQHPI